MPFKANHAGITTATEHMREGRQLGVVIEVPPEVAESDVVDIDAEIGKDVLHRFIRADLPEDAVRHLAKKFAQTVKAWDDEDREEQRRK